MFRLAALTLTSFAIFAVQAQINTYPFVEDFEDFTLVQTTNSCTTPAGMNANGWVQWTADDGDWRSDTAGTGSVGTGPGSSSTTSGVGIGTDVNPGSINGHYLYTEASGCGNAEIGLLSPYFNFSGQDSFFRMKFHYHMFGDGIGSLHIDIFDGVQWNLSQWVQVGEVDSNWNMATLNLANFNDDSVRIRIRGITGSNFRSDICIDNVVIENYSPPRFDAIVSKVSHSNMAYPISPLSQLDSVRVRAEVKNEGVQSITGVQVTVSEGSYSSSINLGTIASFDTASGIVSTAYTATSIGVKELQCVVSINESDSFAFNDTAYASLIVSDSVLARENSNSIAGVGFNGVGGFLGQRFEVKAADTVSSISFFCAGGAGDSVRVYVYAFDTLPGSLLASSEYAILSGTARWYSLALDCEEVLSAGKYFAVVEQVGVNNLGLSMEASGYEPNSVYYRGAGGVIWTPIENAGFEVCYLLRMNFGKVHLPALNLMAASDTICEAERLQLSASGAFTYEWSPAHLMANASSAVTFAQLDTSQWISLIGSNRCGFKDSSMVYIVVEPGPNFDYISDTTVCAMDSLKLWVNSNNAYQWTNGPSNQDYWVQINTDSTFNVRIDSSNGCMRTASINISASMVDLEVVGDTSVCAGEQVQFRASGANSYQWVNGPQDSIYILNALTAGYYSVVGYNLLNCQASDSVQLSILEAPSISLPSDTGACFTDSLYLVLSGADSMYWEGFGSDSILALRVVKMADYVGVAINQNGCSQIDTVHVDVYIPPFALVSNDTTICEGGTAHLVASGGDSYLWSTAEVSAAIDVMPSADATYKVQVFSSNGCSDEDSIRIDVNPLPIAAFDTSKWIDSVQFINASMHADSYKWYFGDGDSSSAMNPSHVYDSNGRYNVILIASNNCGSRDSSLDVTILIPIGSIDGFTKSQIQLYPNPSNSWVTVQMDNSYMGLLNMKLYNQKGSLILEKEGVKYQKRWSTQLDLEGLSQGIYHLRLLLGESEHHLKIVIH